MRHPPLGYFIAQHLPPLQSSSRPATCWAGKYPPPGGKPHARLCSGGRCLSTLEGPTGLVLVQQWPCHDPPVFLRRPSIEVHSVRRPNKWNHSPKRSLEACWRCRLCTRCLSRLRLYPPRFVAVRRDLKI